MQTKQADVAALIANIKEAHGSLPDIERIEIDTKIEMLKTQILEVKNAVTRRIELVTNFIDILQQAEQLSDKFKLAEAMLSNTPDDSKLAQFRSHWDHIKPAYLKLKKDGSHFVADATKVNITLYV